MTSWAQIVRDVQARAQGRCEYCQMHESLQGATFHAEHIQPKVQGGRSEPDNLAWACPSCNLHKGDRTTLTDPSSGESVELFDPRRSKWLDHFRFVGYEIVGTTAVGRAIVDAFRFNVEKRIRIRKAEELFGLFPPVPPGANQLRTDTNDSA